MCAFRTSAASSVVATCSCMASCVGTSSLASTRARLLSSSPSDSSSRFSAASAIFVKVSSTGLLYMCCSTCRGSVQVRTSMHTTRAWDHSLITHFPWPSLLLSMCAYLILPLSSPTNTIYVTVICGSSGVINPALRY